MEIKFKVKEKTYVVEVDSDELKIEELKQKLEAKMEGNEVIPYKDQRFVHGGKFLQNDRTIKDCGITNGMTIFVICAKKTTQATQPTSQSVPQPPPFSQPSFGQPTAPMGGVSPSLINQAAAQQLESIINNPDSIDFYFQSILAGIPEDQRAGWKAMLVQQMKELKNNPELMQQMLQQVSSMSPEAMRSVMGGAPGMGMPGPMAGQPTPYGYMPYGNSPQMQPMGFTPSPTIPCCHGFYPLNTPQPMQFTPPPPINYEEIYSEQLKQLEEMGYVNKKLNIEALKRANGDVCGAVNYIIDWNSGDNK
ncbi:Deubiquitination-protection protein dph1 [Astathelohania contejeani]|uniref:Deubiquitination-protection protein dph1 n=1 Tax=Astathelohania contejeani TaxID=164912 RepID=A0ABQ7HYK7_9MICR|nr:Deubiquitination-protection protein dph1 [Thelohania contejeani]